MRDEGRVLHIGAVIGRAEVGPLCARLADLLRRRGVGGAVVVCDVSAVVGASVVVVEALARLRLTARRLGADLRVRGANEELHGLLAFTGLDTVVLGEAGSALGEAGSALELQGQAEEWEDPLDIEEVGNTANPVA